MSDNNRDLSDASFEELRKLNHYLTAQAELIDEIYAIRINLGLNDNETFMELDKVTMIKYPDKVDHFMFLAEQLAFAIQMISILKRDLAIDAPEEELPLVKKVLGTN